jgi:hypothetical protein
VRQPHTTQLNLANRDYIDESSTLVQPDSPNAGSAMCGFDHTVS